MLVAKPLSNHLLLVFIFTASSLPCSASQRAFPSWFQFGVGTSAYQIEGGWNVTGKGESTWDRITHQQRPSVIADGSTGDVACDSYHQWRRDVEMLAELGVDVYRFSIAWSRIIPNGTTNPDGVAYYNGLIDGLLARGITPMATLFHFDLPVVLQDLGGLLNPDFVGHFVDYAEVVFARFGDRVKSWTTFNEPAHFCTSELFVTGGGGRFSPGVSNYVCGHNLLKAHAVTVQLYRRRFQSVQRGRIGISLGSTWFEPSVGTSAEDQEASQWALQFHLGWLAHPIFSGAGDYPAIVKDRVANLSLQQGYPSSRLPSFSAQEIASLRGSADFLGLNFYNSVLASKNGATNPANYEIPSHDHDAGVATSDDPSWQAMEASWIKVTPFGLRKILNWIREEYGNPPVWVTENGVATAAGTVDLRRVEYLNGHLEALLDAVEDDGCAVEGYLAWSLMDNFEWTFGYSLKFGLFHVDFESANRTRFAKMSAKVYRNVIRTRRVDPGYLPQPDVVLPRPSRASGRGCGVILVVFVGILAI